MNQQTQAQRYRGGILLYALSIISGLANFAALKVLQHITTSASVYSQLSTILLSFTTFQLLTDLGTHTQFLHTYKNAREEERSGIVHLLLQSRLALGVAVVLLSSLYALASHFTSEMACAFIIYQCAFIPFAYMSTVDSVFLARSEFGNAILSRLTRIGALIFFLGAAATQTSLLSFPAVLSTLFFSTAALMVWIFILRKHCSAESHWSFIKPKWWQGTVSTAGRFIKGSSIAGAVIVLQFLQSFVAQIFLIRELGETSLAPINTALVIATPAILAFQTLGQMQLPAVTDWAIKKAKDFRPALFTFALQMLAACLAMALGLFLFQSMGLVNWFFPLSDTKIVQLSYICIAAHALLCFAGTLLVLCQYQGKASAMLRGLGVSVLLSWLCQYLLHRQSHEVALLASLLLFAILISGIGLFIALRERKL